MSEQKRVPNNKECGYIDASAKTCQLLPKKDFTSKGTPCGSPFVYKVDLIIKDGKKIAKRGAKLNNDAVIQAALPSTDIHAIVTRAKMGDLSVLNVHQNGFTGDTTLLPRDIYDYKRMNDLYDKVAGSFDKLPDAIKSLFDNSSEKYLNAILDDSAGKIIKDYKDSQAAEASGNQEGEVNNG